MLPSLLLPFVLWLLLLLLVVAPPWKGEAFYLYPASAPPMPPLSPLLTWRPPPASQLLFGCLRPCCTVQLVACHGLGRVPPPLLDAGGNNFARNRWVHVLLALLGDGEGRGTGLQ